MRVVPLFCAGYVVSGRRRSEGQYYWLKISECRPHEDDRRINIFTGNLQLMLRGSLSTPGRQCREPKARTYPKRPQETFPSDHVAFPKPNGFWARNVVVGGESSYPKEHAAPTNRPRPRIRAKQKHVPDREVFVVIAKKESFGVCRRTKSFGVCRRTIFAWRFYVYAKLHCTPTPRDL